MTRWIDLYGTTGEYVSEVKTMESDFDYYFPKINSDYIENDGTVKMYIRISNDIGETWSEWHEIINDSTPRGLLDGDGFALGSISYQYKVVLDISTNFTGKSPEFKKFDINMLGGYNIFNLGDKICKPEIWIKKINGSGDISLTNETLDITLKLTDLHNNETVYVNCESETILTDLPSTYRYKNHNDVFIELDTGENVLTGSGDFELDIRAEFKLLQG